MKRKPHETVVKSGDTESRGNPGEDIERGRSGAGKKGTDMTILNKTLMAALVSGAVGLALPALAQSNVDPDAPGLTIVTTAPNGPVVVARDDGSTVVTERVVRRQYMVPAGCNSNKAQNLSGLKNPSGGVGGSIGGRMILGTTPADDVPLPGTCVPVPR